MRLTIRALGLDLLDVELSTDAPTPAPDDCSRDLSGAAIFQKDPRGGSFKDPPWAQTRRNKPTTRSLFESPSE